MKRSLMQLYINNTKAAVSFYQKAFDASIVSEHKNEDGSYLHVELDLGGQIIALSESIESDVIIGNTMQFCLQFGDSEKHRIMKAFEILKVNAEILIPLGPCFYSELMVSLVDQYGINWCLFA